jgi:hypothetical protein
MAFVNMFIFFANCVVVFIELFKKQNACDVRICGAFESGMFSNGRVRSCSRLRYRETDRT